MNGNIISTLVLAGLLLSIFLVERFKRLKISSIHAFAIGNRNFYTSSVIMTLIATWISASGFNIDLTRFYNDGWQYLIPALLMIVSVFLVTTFIIPKCSKFLGKTSVASYMGEQYGQKVRMITAIIGSFSVAGSIAIQFKIMGSITYSIFPILPEEIWTVIWSATTVWYCYSGGIYSVIRTDILQAFIFSVVFIIIIFVLQEDIMAKDISNYNTSKFYIKSLLTLSKEQYTEMFFLCCYFLMPNINPTEFQRISLGRNIKQVQISWYTALVGITLAMAVTCYISFLLFILEPNLESNKILSTFINKFVYLKPLIVIGVISMAMSTADSHINISAVMLANDTYKKDSWSPYEKLIIAKKYTFLIGLIAYSVLFIKKDLLEMIMFTSGFYMPLITIPLIITVFNYKISEKCVLISMGITATFWLIWQILYDSEPLIFTMTLNAFLLFTTHRFIDKKSNEQE